MSNWQIVEQTDGEDKVEIKEIRFFPITDKKTKNLTGFGKLKNKTLRVQYAHVRSPDQVWKVTHTRHGFNITCPNRQEYANRLPTDRTKITVPGTCFNGKATSGSMGLNAFMREIVQQTGQETGERIVRLFIDKLAEGRAEAA